MGPIETLAMTPHEVRLRLIQRREVALLDVREEGPYAEAHPLFAASLPLSRIDVKWVQQGSEWQTHPYRDHDNLVPVHR